MRLTDQIVLITGGTGALGQAVTLAFLEAGARVFVTWRHEAANMAAYSVAKGGVITLVEALAEELKDANVQVNCVLPSVIDTPANRGAMPNADPNQWVAPAAIARVILFLASEEAAVISG